MFFSYYSHLLATVNATTQNVIKIYYASHYYDYDSQDMLVVGGYLNIFNYKDYFRIFHTQVNSTLEFSDIPKYQEITSFNFSVTSSYNLADQVLSSYTITDESKSVYTVAGSTSSSLEVYEDDSYVLSMTDSLTQNLTVTPSQNSTVSFNLPCSLVSYGTLQYEVIDNDDSQLPTWVSIDYTNFEMNVQAPGVNQSTVFSFMINTTYPDGWINNSFNLIVELGDDSTPSEDNDTSVPTENNDTSAPSENNDTTVPSENNKLQFQQETTIVQLPQKNKKRLLM